MHAEPRYPARIPKIRDDRDPSTGEIVVPTLWYPADSSTDGVGPHHKTLDLDNLLSTDPKLDKSSLTRIFETMILTREMDEQGMALQRQGRIKFYLLARGHEASHIGSAHALEARDWVVPYYRQPGIPLLRGSDRVTVLQNMINQWYGNAEDITRGRQMPVHYSFRDQNFVSISSVIGTQLAHAVGIGIAAKLRGEDTVAMSYIGDGGTSSNDFHSSLNLAAVRKAPVVFICENNAWGISVPLEHQTASDNIAVKAKAYGMHGVRVDGNDIVAVYAVCKEAVERARMGLGPTLIETVTYRVKEHTSSDGGSYRADIPAEQDLIAAWERHDPIDFLEATLLARGYIKSDDRLRLQGEMKALVKQCVSHAETIGEPPLESLFDDVYAALPPHLLEQFDAVRREASGEGENTGEFPI